MKIIRLETIHVRPRWLILKIHTDCGLIGLGEPSLEGRALAVEAMIHEMGRWLIGQDPRRIEHIWQHLYRGGFYRLGPVECSALSGIDHALWDILGKHLDAPVYQLLGGAVRDRINMYAWIMPESASNYTSPPATQVAGGGLQAWKYNATERFDPIATPADVERAAARALTLRQAYGPEVHLAADFHGRVSASNARRLVEALEPARLMFIEEPVPPGDVAALRDIARFTSTPIAAGERLFTRWQFQDLVAQRAVSVVQPDLAHAGGISEVRRIATMAESREILVAPHCPLGPVCLAASLQVDATLPNFLIQEHVTLGQDYLRTPFVLEDGCIRLPAGAGLGIELDDDKVAAGRFDGHWDNPRYAYNDGSFAEW